MKGISITSPVNGDPLVDLVIGALDGAIRRTITVDGQINLVRGQGQPASVTQGLSSMTVTLTDVSGASSDPCGPIEDPPSTSQGRRRKTERICIAGQKDGLAATTKGSLYRQIKVVNASTLGDAERFSA